MSKSRCVRTRVVGRSLRETQAHDGEEGRRDEEEDCASSASSKQAIKVASDDRGDRMARTETWAGNKSTAVSEERGTREFIRTRRS